MLLLYLVCSCGPDVCPALWERGNRRHVAASKDAHVRDTATGTTCDACLISGPENLERVMTLTPTFQGVLVLVISHSPGIRLLSTDQGM